MKNILFVALFLFAFAANASYTPPGGATGTIQYNNAGSFGGRTPQGSGLKVQMSTGTTTTNDCVKFDSNGNTVPAGAPCGTSTSSTPTIFPCDGSDQTTLISAALVNNANLLFTGTCKTTAITKTGINLTIDFAQGASLTPAGSSLFDVLWKFTSSDVYIKNIVIDGAKITQTAIFFDGGTTPAHKLQVDNALVSNMGSDSLTATNIVTGFEVRNYAVGSLLKLGKFVAKDFNAIGNGSCGDAIGSVRGIYASDNAATMDIDYFEDSGGTDIEDNDFFHSQLNNAGGTIKNFVARYNQNTRRVFKSQSGKWKILSIDARPGPDFVSCSDAGILSPSYCGASAFGSGTQVGKFNLNLVDYAASSGSGTVAVVSGYLDCTGFDFCVADSGAGGIITTGPGLILQGATATATRAATACNSALSSHQTVGFYSPVTDLGSGINGSKFYNFGLAAALQGKQSFSKGAIFYDPVSEAAEISSSTAKTGQQFSDNTIYTVTPGYMPTRVIRVLNAQNAKIYNNTLIEDVNTTHGNKFIDVTDAGATGYAWGNLTQTPGLATTPFTVGSSAFVNCGPNLLSSVVCGGTGITSGTSGGIPYFSSSSTIASSGALTASAITLGGGAGNPPTALGSLGTTTTVLHGNATGAPTFGAVSLTADVSGNLPVTNLNSGTSASNSTFWRGDATWVSVPAILSTTTGIDAKATGTTTLYTVPVGKTAIITGAIIRCTAASSISVGPTLGIGVAVGEDDIFTSTAITALTATTKDFGFQTVGMSVPAAAGALIKVGLDSASTGTSQTIAVDLIGFLI